MITPISKLSVDAALAVGAGVGLVIGAFIPGVLRKVKSALVRIAVKIVKAAEAEGSKLSAEIDAEAAKVDKKL